MGSGGLYCHLSCSELIKKKKKKKGFSRFIATAEKDKDVCFKTFIDEGSFYSVFMLTDFFLYAPKVSSEHNMIPL